MYNSTWAYQLGSGISVQNPNSARPGGRLVRDILRQAAEYAVQRLHHFFPILTKTSVFRRGGVAPPPDARRAGPFSGGGHTLGSDEVESTYVPDPTANDGEFNYRLLL